MRGSNKAVSLSIILPVLNEAGCIVSTLLELRTLRLNGAEIIVVDGGSQDETVTLAAPHAEQVISCARGRAQQMNRGAAAANGEFLLFLHADTRLPDDAWPTLSGAIAKGAVWGRFDVKIEGQPRLLRLIAFMMNLRSRLSGIATGDQGIFVRRTDFERLGGYPPIPLMEDLALSEALKKLAKPACLRSRVVTSGRRWEKYGLWKTIFLMWLLRAAYRCGVSPEILARQYRS
ncbi:TIGR04283 family arsenosugar biosynthesis glycosyltransferase [Dechloromonas sp. A34]|uniref:TIGR04283 family arsenosugar biosynthesis glycosyltransferase n=1 Tax=Dechloromonas sp. A34 TaxID=447588 RepID=UPI002248A867|nr:TIGR04283 family arsenosugar biosynthesis glycosyltransferase [Dechloromonas sp. A34]